MKTTSYLIFQILTISTFAFGNEKKQPLPEVIINDADWPPYFFGKEPKKLGIGKEILQMCVPKAGYKPVFIFHPIERMVHNVQEGSIDLTVFGSVKDEKRRERSTWSMFTTETIFSATYKPVVAAKSNISIKSLQDLADIKLRLGLKQGLKFDKAYDDMVEMRRSKSALENYNLTIQGIEKLTTHRMDVFVEHAESVSSIAKDNEKQDEIKILPFVVKSSDYVVVVSNKSKAIADRVDFGRKLDLCISGLKKDGTYNSILNRYGIKP